jgi:hypothetical protein
MIMNKEFKFQPTLEECYELANKVFNNGNEIVDAMIKKFGSSDDMLRSIRRHLWDAEDKKMIRKLLENVDNELIEKRKCGVLRYSAPNQGKDTDEMKLLKKHERITAAEMLLGDPILAAFYIHDTHELSDSKFINLTQLLADALDSFEEPDAIGKYLTSAISLVE